MVRLDLVLKAGKMEGEETGDGVGDERGEHHSFGFVVSVKAGMRDRNEIIKPRGYPCSFLPGCFSKSESADAGRSYQRGGAILGKDRGPGGEGDGLRGCHPRAPVDRDRACPERNREGSGRPCATTHL